MSLSITDTSKAHLHLVCACICVCLSHQPSEIAVKGKGGESRLSPGVSAAWH